MFSRIGISSTLAGPRLTKLVRQACAEVTKDKPSGVETVDPSDVEDAEDSHVIASVGALMAGAAAKRREREMLFSDVGPCRRALCARRDLAMRKRLRRLTGKVCLSFIISLYIPGESGPAALALGSSLIGTKRTSWFSKTHLYPSLIFTTYEIPAGFRGFS